MCPQFCFTSCYCLFRLCDCSWCSSLVFNYSFLPRILKTFFPLYLASAVALLFLHAPLPVLTFPLVLNHLSLHFWELFVVFLPDHQFFTFEVAQVFCVFHWINLWIPPGSLCACIWVQTFFFYLHNSTMHIFILNMKKAAGALLHIIACKHSIEFRLKHGWWMANNIQKCVFPVENYVQNQPTTAEENILMPFK